MIAIFATNAAWSDFLLPYLVLRGSALQTVMVRLFVFSTEQTVNADTMMRSVVFSMIPAHHPFLHLPEAADRKRRVCGHQGVTL